MLAMSTLLLQNFLKSSIAVQFLQNFKRYFVSPLGNWFYWLNNDPLNIRNERQFFTFLENKEVTAIFH